MGRNKSSVVLAVTLFAIALVFSSGGQATRANELSQSRTRSESSLYNKYCASCHGKDGRAKTFKAKFNSARNIADPAWQEAVSDERIFNSIANGRGKMPGFSKKMTDAKIESLVSLVRRLKNALKN